jgi:hypothetical protein
MPGTRSGVAIASHEDAGHWRASYHDMLNLCFEGLGHLSFRIFLQFLTEYAVAIGAEGEEAHVWIAIKGHLDDGHVLIEQRVSFKTCS